jgi:hypothetical protein
VAGELTQLAPEVEVGNQLGSDGALEKVQVLVGHAAQQVDGQSDAHTEQMM